MELGPVSPFLGEALVPRTGTRRKTCHFPENDMVTLCHIRTFLFA